MQALKNYQVSVKNEKTMGCARFISSMAGCLLRIMVGSALIIVGLAVVYGTGGINLAIVGLVPLAVGLFHSCVFAPLFGGPFWAKDIK